MSKVEQLITDNLAHWSLAIQNRKAVGRGSSKKINLYGIKKLRELILELAVRGKLVPQDSNDEPASVLLERIAAEKAQLVKDKKIKKSKALPEISEGEKPFVLPEGWKWARLGDLSGEIHYGYTASAKHEVDGVRLLRITDIQNDRVQWNTVPACEITHEKSKSYLLENDDILIARTGGTIGKSYLVENINLKAVFASYLIRVKRISAMYASFIKVYLGSPLYWGQLYDNASGTGQPNVNATALKCLTISIPPLAEQHRIVAKVDELMLLCDKLEQQAESSIDAHKVLVETLLTTLTNSKDNAELEQNWQRLAAHFTTLFTTENSIDQLKQTVLQLAVMGKLVPQNPNDEPASVLLKKIAAEKEQLIKDKKIKKQKLLPQITEDEKSFELPRGWEWCRFSELANDVATGPFGTMIHKKDYVDGGVPLINPSHMIDSIIIEDSTISVCQNKAEELSSYRLSTDDIVMARRGEMGRCALVTKREHGWLCGTGSFVLKFNKVINRQYILLLFKTPWVKTFLGGNSIGTTMTNLNHGILNKMPCLLPPKEEKKRIIVRVDQLNTLCDQLKTQIRQAQQARLHLADAMVETALTK